MDDILFSLFALASASLVAVPLLVAQRRRRRVEPREGEEGVESGSLQGDST